MATTSTSIAVAAVEPVFTEPERLALAGFLAGYTGLTRQAYALDLRQYASWCAQHQLRLFQARRAEHAALYAATEPVTQPHPASPRGSELAVAAVRSLDPHQVKLVEACQRGHAATGDPAFAAAAETVTGLHA